ncbi:MFS transporter [Gordonia neofelifaecis]|uniref:Major facilitator superfamily multidrug resistance protein n=1 Tax=Gordonia neofelifaecis NRRL B-59395 TaxID=644548 RepID=F1YIA9_9ACTN|nr:MFS transporter [Gordonia neofelifaecis]EGD55663.1 major facilitator superfamily multidrug resistance protein [Gordonia neofelifaecis NRRL B-59395]
MIASGRITGRARVVVLVVMVALVTEIVTFEYSLVGPALPEIGAAFGTDQSGLVVTATMLIAGISAPVLSKLADIHGKKRLLLCGAGSFMVGSLICALAPNFPALLLGRGLQGAAVVGVVVSIGLMRDLLPPSQVPIALGAMGVGTGTGAVLGPLLGGWLIDSYGFRACFWFLLGYMALAALLVLVVVPESPVRASHRLDVPGALLVGLGVGAVIVASVEPSVRWPAIACAAVLLGAFVAVERRTAEPLISLDLLATPAMRSLLMLGACVGAINAATGVLFPQLLRMPLTDGGLLFDAGQYALYFGLAQGLVGCACGFVGGWLSRRYAPRAGMLLAISALTLAVGLSAAGLVDSRPAVVLVGVLMGIGTGSYFSSSANLVVDSVPANVQSVSQSMKNTTEAMFGATVSAVVGAVIASHVVTGVAGRAIDPAGFTVAFVLCAVIAVVGLAITVFMRAGRAPARGGSTAGTADEPTDDDHPVAVFPTEVPMGTEKGLTSDD